MELFLTDIIQQSETGESGSREAMFTPHIDNNGELSGAVLTAVMQLTNKVSGMRVLGKEEFLYRQKGETAVFPSALFHETTRATPGTMKLSVLLRHHTRKSTEKHEDKLTTRTQLRRMAFFNITAKWLTFDKNSEKGKISQEGENDNSYKAITIMSEKE